MLPVLQIKQFFSLILLFKQNKNNNNNNNPFSYAVSGLQCVVRRELGHAAVPRTVPWQLWSRDPLGCLCRLLCPAAAV